MTDTTKQSPVVVVGVDGSEGAGIAVDWAAAYASRHGWALKLLCGSPPPVMMGMPDGVPAGLVDAVDSAAKGALWDAVGRAEAVAPDLTVTTELIHVRGSVALVDASREAALVVVGSRGRGQVTGLLFGSTGGSVTAAAHCPVVVVHGESDTNESETGESDHENAAGPVVLGVDGDPDHPEFFANVIRFAFEEASATGAELVVLRCWEASFYGVMDPAFFEPKLMDFPAVEATEKSSIEALLKPFREEFPAVRVRVEVSYGRPERALLEASKKARLIVVGSRGHSGLAGLLLGSVSRAIVHHAHAPVAVIRSHRRTGKSE